MAILLLAGGLSAQPNTQKEVNFERLVDELLPLQDLDLNYEDVYENWMQLLSNPLDLNRATKAQLEALFLLTDAQIAALLRHRAESGRFVSLYELQAIPGFTPELIERLALLISITYSPFRQMWRRPEGYWVGRWERRVEPRLGFISMDSTQRFAGSPDKFYQRLRVQQSNLYSLGFTAEKDAGEAMEITQRQAGFDYLSAHLQLKNLGRLKNLTLGDFQAQFGQGLLLGGGFGLGKGGETILTARRSTLGFLPYSSVLESGFFRGAAATVALAKNLFVHGLISQNKRDGRLQADSLESFVSSLPLAGLHRTPSERATRRTVGETNQAAVLQYQSNQLEAGLSWHHTQFSAAVLRPARVYNQFAFSGAQIQNIGAFASYTYKNFSLFGEHGRTLGGGHGTVAGTLANLSERLAVAWHVRHFQRDFLSLYSNAFSENTTPQNEQGVYWGFRYQFSKKVALQGYVDQFRFPWLRFRAYAPGQGHEYLSRFSWAPSKSIRLFAQYRYERKDRNIPSEQTTYQVAAGSRQNVWLNADYGDGAFQFKTRVQWSQFQIQDRTSNGLLLLQDVAFKNKRFTAAMRYAVFDTEDYDNRQYVYERDVWLAFSLPALAGRGIRQYALLQYDVSRTCTIWLRWSITRYANQTSISSGVDQIAGSVVNDLKFQVRFGF
jgi:hypothetical protein